MEGKNCKEMKRIRENRIRAEPWHCTLCNSFQALTLRILLRHYNSVHSNEPNFQVACLVQGCPAKFTIYNSLYKHVLKYHKDDYEGEILCSDEMQQELANNHLEGHNSVYSWGNDSADDSNDEPENSCGDCTSDEDEFYAQTTQVDYYKDCSF